VCVGVRVGVDEHDGEHVDDDVNVGVAVGRERLSFMTRGK